MARSLSSAALLRDWGSPLHRLIRGSLLRFLPSSCLVRVPRTQLTLGCPICSWPHSASLGWLMATSLTPRGAHFGGACQSLPIPHYSSVAVSPFCCPHDCLLLSSGPLGTGSFPCANTQFCGSTSELCPSRACPCLPDSKCRESPGSATLCPAPSHHTHRLAHAFWKLPSSFPPALSSFLVPVQTSTPRSFAPLLHLDLHCQQISALHAVSGELSSRCPIFWMGAVCPASLPMAPRGALTGCGHPALGSSPVPTRG